jgi:hypothetical protein
MSMVRDSMSYMQQGGFTIPAWLNSILQNNKFKLLYWCPCGLFGTRVKGVYILVCVMSHNISCYDDNNETIHNNDNGYIKICWYWSIIAQYDLKRMPFVPLSIYHLSRPKTPSLFYVPKPHDLYVRIAGQQLQIPQISHNTISSYSLPHILIPWLFIT